jgi:hypothetical protein
MTGRISNSNQTLQVSGTVTAPAFSFAGDNDTGAYRKAADTLGFAVGGVAAGFVSPTQLGLGYEALSSLTSGTENVTFGYKAGKALTSGASNAAFGFNSLPVATTASLCTSFGALALLLNTTGAKNAAFGYYALGTNVTGIENTAFGDYALQGFTGNGGAAFGYAALIACTTGAANSAFGYVALTANTTGAFNSGFGYQTLANNLTGDGNSAFGYQALLTNSTGLDNCAFGVAALTANTTGSFNSAFGYTAGSGVTTGSGNIIIGTLTSAGANAPAFAVTTENNRLSMGHTSITNAYIQVAWTVLSDKRDKRDFAPVPHGLDFVSALRPTAFRFKTSRDDDDTPNGPVRYGFLAQDILALEGDKPVIIDAENPDKLQFNDASLIPVLVQAIQELRGMVATLQHRVNQLEG